MAAREGMREDFESGKAAFALLKWRELRYPQYVRGEHCFA